KDTPNPSIIEGTGFEHDPTTGEPNGMLHEAAAWNYIYDALPSDSYFTVDEYRSGFFEFQHDIAAPYGVTGMLVPAGLIKGWNLFTAAQQLSDEDKLTMHYSFMRWADDLAGLEQVPDLIKWRAHFP